jgi:hypothetical protein
MPKKTTGKREPKYFRPSGPALTALGAVSKEVDDDETSIINCSLVLSQLVLTGKTGKALRRLAAEQDKTVEDVLVEVAEELARKQKANQA